MSNFGAMDLSGLTQKDQKVPNQAVADWLVNGDEATLRAYLALSEATPVLMLVTDQSEASTRLRAVVYEVIQASAGRFAGIEISIEQQPQIAQAGRGSSAGSCDAGNSRWSTGPSVSRGGNQGPATKCPHSSAPDGSREENYFPGQRGCST